LEAVFCFLQDASTNATQYTPAGGSQSVALRGQKKGLAIVTSPAPEPFYECGCGINPAKVLPLNFELTERT